MFRILTAPMVECARGDVRTMTEGGEGGATAANRQHRVGRRLKQAPDGGPREFARALDVPLIRHVSAQTADCLPPSPPPAMSYSGPVNTGADEQRRLF